MNELEERAKHERNLLAQVGEKARYDRDVIDIARNAAHALYLRDERIRDLEKQIAEWRAAFLPRSRPFPKDEP
ncbi:hypothetical protein UFOVP1382_114 [uncultured Caudovirales phage]|uniref:Uncharacterized protein n=1 Tax=uncultured Caudovirales phage TaxID=2100421 RepID=A0A6J5S3E6_9CAUD|nr:hypothetical protein UFOVP1382_114 [uncultured Caudovirales phage]